VVCAYIPRTSSNELPLGKLHIPLLHNGETQVPQKGIYRISLHTQRNFQVHPISLRMTWIQPTKATLVPMLQHHHQLSNTALFSAEDDMHPEFTKIRHFARNFTHCPLRSYRARDICTSQHYSTKIPVDGLLNTNEGWDPSSQ